MVRVACRIVPIIVPMPTIIWFALLACHVDSVLLLLKEGHKDPLFGEKGTTLGIQYDIAQKRWMREEQRWPYNFWRETRYSTWRVKAGT